MNEPRPVQLPVCPTCGNVGKQPGHLAKTKFYCAGADPQHKRVEMDLIWFWPGKEPAK